MPDQRLEVAKAAIQYAQSVRKYHAKRTRRGSMQRETDIQIALDRLRAAMKPLRAEVGRYPFGPQTDAALARYEDYSRVSKLIQAERRKLWKMQKRGKK